MSSLAREQLKDPGRTVALERSSYNDIPALMRVELNADSDRHVLVRMQHLAQKKRSSRPEITDEEMADYLALAENYENFDQWLKSRRGPALTASRGTVAWVLGTLAILALLTTGLIAAIAVTVSGL